MDEIVLQGIERSILAMRENLGERLTIDDMARAALFSKFHFSRMFSRLTGVSPGRFLSALRLAEAKRLLLVTSISVADISHRVGYNSVGTFSWRFRTSVGLAPTTFRQVGGQTTRIPIYDGGGPESTVTVRGQIGGPLSTSFGPVFAGLFSGRITDGTPARYTFLTGPGSYTLADVPRGSWYLMAHSVGVDELGTRPYIGHAGPISAEDGVTATLADIRLRPRRAFDPPVLLALPDLRRTATHAVAV